MEKTPNIISGSFASEKTPAMAGKVKIILCFILILNGSFQRLNIFAQNLVPNPSFEQFDTCYFSGVNCSGGVYNGKVLFWDSPNGSTSDLYMSCSSAPYCDVPTNVLGYQKARTGNAYVGEACFGSGREYIQTQLDSLLIVNHKYCVTFYVNLSDIVSLACNNIGMYFSNTHTSSGILIGLTPQILDTTIITDTTNWTLVSGEYIASGGEQFIIIGNFNTNATTSTIIVNNNTDSYYYIDDVSVWDCTGSGLGVDELSDNNISISPNPTRGVFTVSTKQKVKNINIYNVLGEVVFTTTTANPQTTIDMSSEANGIYFVEMSAEKGVMRKKFIKE